MNSLGQLVAIGIISSLAAGGTFLIKGPPLRRLVCDPATLKPDEICLQQINLTDKILWVDARSRTEWKKNGFAGSSLWSLEAGEDMQAFETDIAMKVIETPRVIVYCGSEACGLSREVAGRIQNLQLGAEVSVLHGGWRALSEAGLIKDSNPGS